MHLERLRALAAIYICGFRWYWSLVTTAKISYFSVNLDLSLEFLTNPILIILGDDWSVIGK